MTKHLFVYGTLMSTMGARMTSEPRIKLIGGDFINGKIFDLGSFPGVILGDEGSIKGEIYEILDSSVLGGLDAYEGYVGDDEYSLYIRRVVTSYNGVETYVYEYNHATDGMIQIEDGDYLKYRRGDRS